MKTVAWLIRGTLALAAIILVIVFVSTNVLAGSSHTVPPAAHCSAGSTKTDCRAAAPPAPGHPQVRWSQGIPAIKPRLGATSASVPAFSAADIRQWISSNHLANQVKGSATPTVTSISFLTTEQVSQKLNGEDVGTAPGALLCYVTVHGSFVGYQPLAGSPPFYYSNGYVVFDAHTGNIVLSNVE